MFKTAFLQKKLLQFQNHKTASTVGDKAIKCESFYTCKWRTNLSGLKIWAYTILAGFWYFFLSNKLFKTTQPILKSNSTSILLLFCLLALCIFPLPFSVEVWFPGLLNVKELESLPFFNQLAAIFASYVIKNPATFLFFYYNTIKLIL